MPARLSGIQKDVLSLYRSFIRMIGTKPPHTRPHFLLMTRYNFHTNAHSISPRDINAIEHLLRRNRRQLEMYADPGVKDCHVSDAMRKWEAEVYRRHLPNPNM